MDVRGVGRAHEDGVRGLRRPTGKIGGAKIGGVEFCAGDLGDAVNAPGPVGGRIPVLSSRQRLARRECGLCRRCQTREAERNAARRDPLDELASRRPHAPTSWSALYERVARLLVMHAKSRGTPIAIDSSRLTGQRPLYASWAPRRAVLDSQG